MRSEGARDVDAHEAASTTRLYIDMHYVGIAAYTLHIDEASFNDDTGSVVSKEGLRPTVPGFSATLGQCAHSILSLGEHRNLHLVRDTSKVPRAHGPLEERCSILDDFPRSVCGLRSHHGGLQPVHALLLGTQTT